MQYDEEKLKHEFVLSGKSIIDGVMSSESVMSGVRLVVKQFNSRAASVRDAREKGRGQNKEAENTSTINHIGFSFDVNVLYEKEIPILFYTFERKKERKRETDRQTNKQIGRQIYKQTERNIEKERQKEKETDRGRERKRQREKETERERDRDRQTTDRNPERERKRQRQIDKDRDRNRDRQTDRQTGRQAGRQTGTKMERDRNSERGYNPKTPSNFWNNPKDSTIG